MSKVLNLLFFFGRPFSPLYSLVMKSREKLYGAGVLRQYALPVPIISVGNLVLGGTGKTPTVRHLVNLLLQQGLQPVIVSRGYGGQARGRVNVVSDGKRILLPASLAGDEPFMLAESLPGVPVLTGTRRIFPCRHAIDNFNADVVILDDGFQHLAVKKDIDLVLFDCSTLAGNSRVFPGGHLREPASALNRCHAFLLTGKTAGNEARTNCFTNLLRQRYPDRPVFTSSFGSYTLVEPNGSPAGACTSAKYFAFCGIANPARFESSLAELGLLLVAFQPLRDHARYTQTLVSNLCAKAISCGAERLVTTEKDFVKLKDLTLQLPLHVLQVQHHMEPSFDRFLLDTLKKIRK